MKLPNFRVLSIAAAEARELQEDARTLARAVRLNPDSAVVGWQRARLLLRKGRLAAAQAAAQEAAQRMPMFEDAFLTSAEAHLMAGEVNLASICRQQVRVSAGPRRLADLRRLDARLSLAQEMMALGVPVATPAHLVAAAGDYVRDACQRGRNLGPALTLVRALTACDYPAVCRPEVDLYTLHLLILAGDVRPLASFVAQLRWRDWMPSLRLTLMGGELMVLVGAHAIGEALFRHGAGLLAGAHDRGEPVSEAAVNQAASLLLDLQRIGRLLDVQPRVPAAVPALAPVR